MLCPAETNEALDPCVVRTTVLWIGQGRGEASVAGVELKGVEHPRGLGGLSLCLRSKRKKFGELLVGDGIC